jgi:hypothetical protein
MTSDYLASKTDFGSSLFSDVPRTKSYSATKIVAYAGPQINLLFNRSFGITMESRFASGKSQQYGAGLIFRF